MSREVKLSPEAVKEINDILSRGKGVEIGIRSGKLIVWEMTSKKKHEVAI